MKRVKRFLGLLLAFLLVFNVVPSYAEEDPDNSTEEVVAETVEEEEKKEIVEPETPVVEEKVAGDTVVENKDIPTENPTVPEGIPAEQVYEEKVAGDNTGSGDPHEGHTILTEIKDDYEIKTCYECNEVISKTYVGCEHEWEVVYDIPATCDEYSVLLKTCKKCGKNEVTQGTEYGEHTFEAITTVPASCTEQGYTYYRCSTCHNADKKDDYTAPLGHDYQLVDEEHDGIIVHLKRCSRCNNTIVVGSDLDHHVHIYNGVITKEPTCTEDGIRTYTCVSADCDGSEGATYTEVIPKFEHLYDWRVLEEPSCVEPGSKTQYCRYCGAVGETEEIPALGHKYNEYGLMEVITPPDCYNTGIKVAKCLVCGYHDERVMPKTNHEFTEEIDRRESTCKTKGYITYQCENCSDTKDVELPLADHTWTSDSKAATCTEAGYTRDYCTVCGAEQNKVVVPMIEHNYELVSSTPATCTEASTEEYRCTICGDTKTEHSVEATGHNMSDWTVTKAPTCTVTGIETKTCQNAGCTYVETREVEKLPHSYEWVVTTEPTYTSTGVKSHKCTVCGDIDDTMVLEKIDHEHNYGEGTVVTAPTCQTEGVGTHTCTICNETSNYVIPKVGHSYGEAQVDRASTCVTPGQSSKKCIWCGIVDGTSITTLPLAEHTYSDEYTIDVLPTCTAEGSKSRHCMVDGCTSTTDATAIEKIDHIMEEVSRTEPTCTEDGSINYKCKNCDETSSTPIEKYGHNYVENVTAPTCTEEGFTTYVCSRCNDTYTGNTVSALGHNPSETPVVENLVNPTCKAEGSYDEVTYCTRCNVEISRTGKTIEKIAHTPGAPVHENEVEATCTEDGSYDEVTYCTVCGDLLSTTPKTVEALGHNYNSVDTDPTCTEDGYTTHVCARCNDTYTDSIVPALGHVPSTPVHENEVAATCTESGSYDEVINCTRCNVEISRTPITVEALGHDVVDTVVAPTCTEDGYTKHVCTRCNEETIDTTVPATGHTPAQSVEENRVEPSCTEDGSVNDVVRCATCNEVISSTPRTITKLGHEAGAVVSENTIPATCTKDGSYDEVTYCTRCNTELSRTNKSITKLGHIEQAPVDRNKIDPTCTEDGSVDKVVYCARCNQEVSRTPETIPALGHDIVDTVVAPTCTKEGYTLHKCSRCEYETTDTPTEKVAHEPAEWVVTVEPTCTAVGTKELHCKVCDTLLNTDEVAINPENHTFAEESTIKVAPTCTEKGVKTLTCTSCNIQKDVEVDALGHTFDNGKVTKEATYDAEGVKTYTCTVCGETKTETIAKRVRPSEENSSDNNSSNNEENTSSEVTAAPVAQTPVNVQTPAQEVAQTPNQNTENQETPAQTPEAAAMLPDASAKVDVSNDELLEDVFTKTGETITAEVTSLELSKDVLTAAKENNNTIVLKSNGYSWTINGSDIENPQDIDLGVVVGTNNIATEDIQEIANGNDFVPIALNYEGEFGFTATLAIDVDNKYEGKTAVLYYFNNGVFEEMGRTVVTDASASFDFMHASEYVVVFEETATKVKEAVEETVEKAEITSAASETVTEKTNTHVIFAAIVIVFLILVLAIPAIISKKRKENE